MTLEETGAVYVKEKESDSEIETQTTEVNGMRVRFTKKH